MYKVTEYNIYSRVSIFARGAALCMSWLVTTLPTYNGQQSNSHITKFWGSLCGAGTRQSVTLLTLQIQQQQQQPGWHNRKTRPGRQWLTRQPARLASEAFLQRCLQPLGIKWLSLMTRKNQNRNKMQISHFFIDICSLITFWCSCFALSDIHGKIHEKFASFLF